MNGAPLGAHPGQAWGVNPPGMGDGNRATIGHTAQLMHAPC